MLEERSCLSSDAMLRHLKAERLFILPFNRRNMGTSQYDVRLGSFYFRESLNGARSEVFNVYRKDDVDRVWGSQWHEAELHSQWADRENRGRLLENIAPNERIIMMEPGETILGHTIEFIGGNDNRITTKMQARSSLGRSYIEVCKCAGMGDVGFCSRWTMEITNNSRSQRIPLIVGMRIAQITFFETEGVTGKTYRDGGKYQSNESLADMVRGWNPEMMKPKLYKDWELREGFGYRHFAQEYNEQVENFLRTGKVLIGD
ncbi:MAG: hypothetical protein Q8Q39_03665 [bacterium]|nr:hypothetical protein [bacterium]